MSNLEKQAADYGEAVARKTILAKIKFKTDSK